jgi:hypothetical protein
VALGKGEGDIVNAAGLDKKDAGRPRDHFRALHEDITAPAILRIVEFFSRHQRMDVRRSELIGTLHESSGRRFMSGCRRSVDSQRGSNAGLQ